MNDRTVYHIIPETGVLPHEQSVSCWCAPDITSNPAIRNFIATHHAYDERMNPISGAPAPGDDDTDSDSDEDD